MGTGSPAPDPGRRRRPVAGRRHRPPPSGAGKKRLGPVQCGFFRRTRRVGRRGGPAPERPGNPTTLGQRSLTSSGVAKAPQSQCRAERFANLDLGCDHPLGGAGTAPTWEQTTEAVSQALRRTAASGSPRRKPTATAAVNESPAPTVSRTMHGIPG